tara:strand:+ start:4955 stop:6109 length:1155 start_codon:yes stop_codon:yes gene_type:complete
MIINIFGSTGIIGSKTLLILKKYFPEIKINLLVANNNYKKLIYQVKIFKPKYIYLQDESKSQILKKNINQKTIVFNFNELKAYLKTSKSDYSILAISGFRSLNYLELILDNTASLGLVSKEAIVSAGHLFRKYKKKIINKIYPLDSEHFSIFKTLHSYDNNKLESLTITASGGPFFGQKFLELKDVSFSSASKHPMWKMGYKNSIDSATLVNKCLEIVEAHYLFGISYDKIRVLIHPEAKVHSILEFKNFLYNMTLFYNDMTIPIYHFLNQNFNYKLKSDIFNFHRLDRNSLNFYKVKKNEFPILKFFNSLDKNDPSNVIKFNVANEYAVNLFKKNQIKYTEIFNFIKKITSLNWNSNLKNINDIIYFHEQLEQQITCKIKNFV